MENNIGIVLKSYLPQKSKLTILDRDEGKIVAVPHRSDISHGSLISYVKREQENIYFIYSINIIDMPFALAQEDIAFVHHVLELCYYFIPRGAQAQKAFRLLLRFYEIPTLLHSSYMKKIFLVQIFFSLGVYPDDRGSRSARIHDLAGVSIDFFANQPIDLMVERELDEWLVKSVKTHPCADYFKTMNFLRKNKAV